MRYGLATSVATMLVMAQHSPNAFAQTASFVAGDSFEVRRQLVSETSGDGMSGSSHDVWTLVERVLATRDGGAELELDLPLKTPPQDRVKQWQFPIRVFVAPGHSPKLLNATDMMARITAWLGDDAKSMCGRWVFTWTAQKVECDPQSALGILGDYQQPTGLHDGALYAEPANKASGPLHLTTHDGGGVSYSATLTIDGDELKRRRAEQDVAVAQMMGRTVTLESALAARAGEQVSGRLDVAIDVDADGRPAHRARIMTIDITSASGAHERTIATETTDWKQTARASSPH